MAEWSIAAVLKTVVLRGTRGSNPCLSAIILKISVPKSEQLLRRKGSNLYKNTHNGFDFKSRLRSGNILSEFNRNYGNPNAAMSEMSKVTDYTSKNAPITLFQDAEEVARFKTTGNKKRLIDYMKFTDRLHNR